MNVIAIVPQLSQPRCIKRLNVLVENGIHVDVFGFDNGLYSDNLKDYKCKVHAFKVEGKKSKIASVKRNANLIKSAIRNSVKGDIFYIFGIEFAGYYKLLLGKRPYIYEQADLNYTKIKYPIFRNLFKHVDKLLIKKSAQTVLTSMGFVHYLYGEMAVSKNLTILENRLDMKLSSIPEPSPRKTDIEHLNFGFVGAIRYPRTILTFARVIGEKYPQHSFHFFGEGFSSDLAKELCAKYPNLHYNGRFRNPMDLPAIYAQLDVNIVCYDPLSLNVRIAEPNKLYESVFFKVPLVVSKGTYLEQRVKEWGVGFSVNAYDEKDVAEFVSSLTLPLLHETVESMRKVQKESLFDNTMVLVDKIRNL